MNLQLAAQKISKKTTLLSILFTAPWLFYVLIGSIADIKYNYSQAKVAKANKDTFIEKRNLLDCTTHIAEQMAIFSPMVIMALNNNYALLPYYAISNAIIYPTNNFLKTKFPKSRPDKSDQKSFPSGHASFSTAGFIFIFLQTTIAGWLPWLLMVMGIMASRVYGLHHFSEDVIIGALSSVVIIFLVMVIINEIIKENQQSKNKLHRK